MSVFGFHSISFPSEWGPILGEDGKPRACRFHSISFPSEWGLPEFFVLLKSEIVSIQLVSPASGDSHLHRDLPSLCK